MGRNPSAHYNSVVVRMAWRLSLVTLIAGGMAGCSQPPPVTHGWAMVASVRVGQTPGPVTLGGRWAFVANMSDGTVSQIDRASGKLVQPLPCVREFLVVGRQDPLVEKMCSQFQSCKEVGRLRVARLPAQEKGRQRQ